MVVHGVCFASIVMVGGASPAPPRLEAPGRSGGTCPALEGAGSGEGDVWQLQVTH